jgi:hypothetical protein
VGKRQLIFGVSELHPGYPLGKPSMRSAMMLR